MTHENLYNLAVLAYFLETEVGDEHFDIENFRGGNDNKLIAKKMFNECGTVGCAVGWAPFVFKNISFRFDPSGKKYFSGFKTAAKLFGVEDKKFDFLFSGEWSGTPQGTRKATIKRIREFIENEGELTSKNYKLMEKYNII